MGDLKLDIKISKILTKCIISEMFNYFDTRRKCHQASCQLQLLRRNKKNSENA